MADLITSKGSSWEIKPGVYQYRFSLGTDPVSKKRMYSPKRTLHCESTTKRGREAELRKAMEDYRLELNTGVVPEKKTARTVGEYADEFHLLRKGTMRSELSYKREGLDIKHIKTLFGKARLTALKAPIIKHVYAEVRETGMFSESELHKIHSKLSQIMSEAVKDELISKNPCDAVSVPRPAAKERQALSAEEAARLLSELQKDFNECMGDLEGIPSLQLIPKLVGVMLLLDSGMRRGEMLGLQWKNVNFEQGSIYICQQYANDKVLREPKSKNSKRHIFLSEGMMNLLREWLPVQQQYFSLKKTSHGDRSPVVNGDECGFLDPNNFNRWFRVWCSKKGFGKFSNPEESYVDAQGKTRIRRTGYEGLTPHMLRHTQATLLIGASADIKTVQSRLGHSSVNLTLNTYSHAIAANDKKAAETFSGLLSAQSQV